MKFLQKLVSFIMIFCILASVSPLAYATGTKHEFAYVSAQGNVATTRLLAEDNCSLFAAQYAENGQLLGVGTVDVPGKDGWQTVSIPLQETEEDFDLKVFLLDRNTKAPLSDSYILKHAGTASERYSIVGVDAEPEAIVATVTTDEACTMEVQVWDQEESKLLFTTTAKAAAGLTLQYVSADYTDTLPEHFILRAVLKNEEGNAVSNPYINRRNTEKFLNFANQTEEDYRNRTDVTFLEVGDTDDGNFMVLNGDVAYLTCSDSANTFMGESNGVLTFKNADSALTGLKAGDLFAFQNADGQYETVKIKKITVNNGVVTITQDEDVYLADFYAMVKINADLTYEGDKDDTVESTQPAMLNAARKAEPETQLLKVEFGPAVKTNVKLGVVSVEGKLHAGGKVSINYNPEELGEDYMDVAVIAGFKGEMKVTLGVAKDWKDSLTLCSIPLAGVKEALGASLDADLVCQIDGDFGYNFTLEAETCYGFTYSTDTGGQVLKQEYFTQKDATSGSELAGHAEIEIGIRGGLKLSLLDELVLVSAGAEGGLVLSGDLKILSGSLPVNALSYHACNLCIEGDVKSYFEIDTTVDYKINRWLTGTLLDLDLFRIETTLGSFYLSLFNDADSVHEGAVAFGWADFCPNKKYRVEIHTYDAVSDKEIVDCPVAVINENNNSDSVVSPAKLYLYPGIYTAKATIGQNQAEKIFTVKDAAMTIQITGEDNVLFGQVSDKHTKRTIEGATVQVNQGNETLFTATTNVMGEYSFKLPDGEYRVIFNAGGYESQVYPLTLTADKNLDVAMESEPYYLYFNANGGIGAMEAIEFHRDQIITLPECTFIPPEGKVFRGWLIGNDLICDAGTAYDPPEENHTLTATWENKEKTYTVTVTVRNEDGTAASGQAIAGTGLATDPVTGSDGTVAVELVPGTYKLTATDANNNYAAAEIELTENTAVTLTLKKKEPTVECSFDETTGVLTITGDGGPMPNYTYDSPWWQYRKEITSVVLSGVTTIGKTAFSSCEGLKSVTIPDGVTHIYSSAFSGCKLLSSIAIPDSVTEIGMYAFSECTSLTSVTLPDSITEIGTNAFYKCTSLASITLPDSITTIGNYTFQNCTSLTSITIPAGVTHIGIRAFSSCTSLTSITLPDTLTLIGAYAFQYCTSLTSIDLSDNCKRIHEYAFYKCTSLTSITLPANCESIQDYAFQDCKSLTSIAIPDSVRYLGMGVFWNCTSLTSVFIPVSITNLNYMFKDCTALTDVYYSGSAEDWDNISINSSHNYNKHLVNATIHYNSTGE